MQLHYLHHTPEIIRNSQTQLQSNYSMDIFSQWHSRKRNSGLPSEKCHNTRNSYHGYDLPYGLNLITKKKYQENSFKILKTQSRHKGKKYFQYLDGPQSKLWFHSFEIDREAIVICARIRSNHYSLNASLHRCNIIQDPSCHCGHPVQDVYHIFWHCPTYSASREILIKQLTLHKIQPPYQIQEILRKPTLGVIKSIHFFLKTNNIHI